MKYIKKGRQPSALIAIHKNKSKENYQTYDNVSDNHSKGITVYSDTLQSLMTEQGFICCYCMQRIDINKESKLKPTIEHYIPRKPYKFDEILLEETKKKDNTVEGIKDELLLLNIPSLPKLDKLSNDKVLVSLKNYFTKEGTNYNNMLATCHGNDKNDPDNKHCDRSKENSFLKYLNPLNMNIETALGYADDGSIICKDKTNKSDIEDDIELLNLNFQKLKDSRKSVTTHLPN